MIRFLTIAFFIPCIAFAQDFRPEPEISTGVENVSKATGTDFMIATANPLATQAGYDILKQGGSAADAAITAQLVLGLVEPQSSGLGGGAFALYYDAKNKQLTSWDGRETVPHSATPDMFLDDNGQLIPFWDAVVGAQSIGIPGTPKLLSTLHQKFGQLDWETLFDRPIDIAQVGFKKSPRLKQMIMADKGKLDRFDDTRDYFYPISSSSDLIGGFSQFTDPLVKTTDDDILKNPDYASTLRLFQTMGSSIFYDDNLVGGHIIKATDGRVNEADLKNYKVIERTPVCDNYRGYKICSMNEPSSGGLTILQILKLLEPYTLTPPPSLRRRPQSTSTIDSGLRRSDDNWEITIHRIAEASKMAFADRNMYMADPDFVDTPGTALLNHDYITKRRALISDKAQSYTAGDLTDIFGTHPSQPEEGTTHIVAVDKHGNAMSMTSTIESAFGSKIMTNGFLLNNEMTDFSFQPVKDGRPVANAIEVGKRPRSSMAPTIVFDKDGTPLLLIGSAGGSRIIGYVLQRIIAVLDWGMDIDDALAMPSFLDRGNGLEIEENFDITPQLDRRILIKNKQDPLVKPGDGALKRLKNKNHDIQIRDLTSGLTAIHINDNIITGASDPRREGIALGE